MIVIAGAGPGTGNFGVDALRLSVASGLRQRIERVQFVYLGHSSMASEPKLLANGDIVVPTSLSLRMYRRNGLVRTYCAMRWGKGSDEIPAILRRVSCSCDISGGDSFTDLYGYKVFCAQVMRKRLFVDAGIPLILLPQTYGPFNNAVLRRFASDVVSRATQVWARDSRSLEVLRDLLGDRFTPSRHRVGVDVAFALPPCDTASTPLNLGPEHVGVNVSGLIWNNPGMAVRRYRFTADYRRSLIEIIHRLCIDSRIVLIPHVLRPKGHPESDRDACEDLLRSVSREFRERITICPDLRDPSEAKSVIAQCQWFLGTRMHATIAGLSSGVPTCTIAYSNKALGVFESCGLGHCVHDPRSMDSDELVRRVMTSYLERASDRAVLSVKVPHVLEQANLQMSEIAAECIRLANRRGDAGT